MEQQDNQIRTSQEEMDTLKEVFKNNEKLVHAMRGVMLNLPDVTDEDRALVHNTFKRNKKLYEVVCQRFLPKLKKDSPIGTAQDAWLGTEEMVFGRNAQTIKQALLFKNAAIRMTRDALDRLVGKKTEAFVLDYNPTTIKDFESDLGISLLARNITIRQIETQLSAIWLIANREQEPKDTRLDSTR